MSSSVFVDGYCEPRFQAVKEVFAHNLSSGEDIGASFAVTVNGKFVVDLWGGYADLAKTRRWQSDTIICVYSTTKAMAVLCGLILVDRGLLDLDAPVAKYWPEFAQAGKEKLPVRYLFSHQSGLAGWDTPITMDTLYNWGRCVSLLAAQEPWWEPGKHSGYHTVTHGYLLGELVKRITHKTLGTFFREEVAIPLNADFNIGFPEAYDCRFAELKPRPILKPGDPDYIYYPPGSISYRSFINPIHYTERTCERAWRAAEIPASNGHGNARSVAKIAALLACGGELNGIRLLSMPTIEKIIEQQCYGMDLVLGIPIRWGLGFQLTSKEMPVYQNPRSFWWFGAGGSHIAIDLDARLSLSYVMNKMNNGLLGDKRVEGLIKAVYQSI